MMHHVCNLVDERCREPLIPKLKLTLLGFETHSTASEAPPGPSRSFGELYRTQHLLSSWRACCEKEEVDRCERKL